MSVPEGFIEQQFSDDETAKRRAQLSKEYDNFFYEIPAKADIKQESAKAEEEYSPTMSANQRKEYFIRNRQFRDLAKEYAKDYLDGKTEALEIYLPDLRSIVEEEFLSAENPREVVFQALREILRNDKVAQQLADALAQEFLPVN